MSCADCESQALPVCPSFWHTAHSEPGFEGNYRGFNIFHMVRITDFSTRSTDKMLLTRIENGVGGLPEVLNLVTAMTEVTSEASNILNWTCRNAPT